MSTKQELLDAHDAKTATQCAACAAAFPRHYAGGLTSVGVSVGRRAFRICAGRHPVSESCRGVAHVKLSCWQKLLTEYPRCPACGEHGHAGELCEACDDVFAKATALRALVPVGIYRLTPSVPALAREDAERVECLLARAVSPYAHRGNLDARSVVPKVDGRARDVWCEIADVHPAQVAPIGELAAALREAFEAQRRAGRAEGRALLAQLAAGELTTAQFDDEAARQDDPER